MKKFASSMSAVLALSALAVACTPATAAEFSLGYQDNSVIDEEGVAASLGTEVNNIRFGLNTFTSSDRLESYGAYAELPINIHRTKFTVTPQLQVDQYREADEVVGGLGLGVEYALTESTRLEAVAMAHEGFDESEFDGETYTVGVTKTF